MTLEQVYAAIGGDYKGVMERLPSADFVRRFALKFLQDDSFPNLKKALEEKDAPTAFRAAHTLKGVCQNLGFDALYVPSSALTCKLCLSSNKVCGLCCQTRITRRKKKRQGERL